MATVAARLAWTRRAVPCWSCRWLDCWPDGSFPGSTRANRVLAGQKIGMITFGSRTDLIVARDAGVPLVEIGQKVVGGRTPIARWRSRVRTLASIPDVTRTR